MNISRNYTCPKGIIRKCFSQRFVFALLALLMACNVVLPAAYAVQADGPLPESEKKALDNFTHWVGVCGSDISVGDAITEAASITPGPIYIMGDSITNSAKNSYKNKFKSPWKPTVEGLDSRQITGSRPSPSGIGQIQKDKNKIGDASAIVIALGTNGVTNPAATTTAQVKQFMEKLKPLNKKNAPVFWVNVIDSKRDAASKTTNKAIEEAVGNDATIIDWYTAAKSGASLSSFESGIHPTKQEDIYLLVNTVYEAVSQAAPPTTAAAASPATPTNGPVSTTKPTPSTNIKVGDAFKGTASNYGWDPVTKYVDPNDANDPASGISNDNPGIAVYNRGTLKGYWLVTTEDGKSAILQQTDVGPGSVNAFIDINTVAVRSVFGMEQGNSFLKKNWTFKYLGKDKPAGAITTDSGKKEDRTSANPESAAAAPAQTAQLCCPTSTENGDAALVGGDKPEKVYNFFVGKGLKPYQAAGIMGNIQHESGFEPKKIEGGKLSEDPADAGTGGYGIVQFTAGNGEQSKTKVDGIIEAAGITGAPHELQTQLEMIWAQLEGKAGKWSEEQAGKDIKASKNVEDATRAWQGDNRAGGSYIGYERPASQTGSLQKRIKAARGYLTKYGSGGSPAADAAANDPNAPEPSPSIQGSDASVVCCPPEGSLGTGEPVEDGSPSDWKKMYTGANKAKVDRMARGKITPNTLVIHYTVGSQEGQALLDFFTSGGRVTGIQFNVGKDGQVYQYYPLNDMQKVNHVGNANAKSIGIEITGMDVTEIINNEKQFQAVAALSKFLCDKYQIPCSQPKGDITGDGIEGMQGMIGHDETPTNDHTDPDATKAEATKGIDRTDSSKHPYMKKLRTALGFDPTPGKQGGGASEAAVTDPSTNGQCAGNDSASGTGTKENPVGEGPNKSLALEAVKYDTKANDNKYTYKMGGLHGPLSQLKAFAQNGGEADCSGFVRYVIWKVYGHDVGSFVTQDLPGNKNFREVAAADVAAGDIGWRSEHVDFITENKGGGKLHQFGAHSTANDLYGGDIPASGYTKYYRYVGPKGGGGQ